MDDNIGLLLLLQVILIALNAVFACAEIAVLSINETKLERMVQDGNAKAKRLYKLTKEPAEFLSTIQVGITLAGFLGSAFAADNFAEPLVAWLSTIGIKIPNSVAVILITLILSYFTLIFGELVPKRIAMKKSESVAMGISGLVSSISFLFKPIVWFLSVSTNLVLRLFGIDPNQAQDDVSEEEIRMMVDAGSEKGTIDYQEKEFIQNVFEFNDITAGEIITHRTDVDILWAKDDDKEWAELIHKTRHSYYPVCDNSADDIIGVLNAKDYFRLENKDRDVILKEAVHPAYFVPETIKADVLFTNMKQARNSFAVVIDEYGGMEGIITLYDLIEELVGEFSDQDSLEEDDSPYVEKTGDNEWEVTGNISLRDLEDELGLELVTEDYDTFTGLLFDILGVIPEDGNEQIEVQTDDMIVTIKLIESHQVEKATIVLKDKTPQDEQEEE
ncbi:MAG: hemolysin family protein [Acutalibacteraceae bacterium]|nr:hemolysin family protein [Acutalibacteraceae bacterium]